MSEQRFTAMNRETHFELSQKIRWGRNISFGPNCKHVQIGYGGFIGNDIYIDVEHLVLGDYVTIHHGSVIHGKVCTIGHNGWFGHYCILDSLGGKLVIENNVGVGAHSQLWTHMKFGDRLDGCRWYSHGELRIGHDAWFVGHCIVAAITVEPRAMLLVGGVATQDMKENRIYAGTPAKDITDRMGQQFRPMSEGEKEALFREYLEEYEGMGNDIGFIRAVDDFTDLDNSGKYTYFNLKKRTYLPRYCEEEYAFMRFLLYEKAKFIPEDRTD